MIDKVTQEHVEPRPCKFCGQNATYAPLRAMENYQISVYYCFHCSAEYLYWKGSKNTISTSLYAKINDKMYRWTVTDFSGTLWYVKTPGEPGTRVNHDLERIVSFGPGFHSFGFDLNQPIPEITPQTIVAKIKTWLLFS